ncbi:MAG: porin family protein [Sphingomonadales bacterium]|nr:porin family protein [Sphingomonadales bacterium]MDE2169321.1 porin family protein [Sphingomonadales bacterium]
MTSISNAKTAPRTVIAKSIAGALTAAALSFAVNAHAQTTSPSAFDGPFVGAQGGWEENSVRNPATAIGTTPLVQTSDTGTLGIFAGYDKQVYPRVVVGAQAELNFPIDSRFGNDLTSMRAKRSVDLSLRAGYLVTPATLVYVRGGYSNALVDAVYNAPGGAIHASDDRDGWTLGGGVERKLTSHISARIEYRYADFSEGNGKFDRHQILTGLAYRF